MHAGLQLALATAALLAAAYAAVPHPPSRPPAADSLIAPTARPAHSAGTSQVRGHDTNPRPHAVATGATTASPIR
ncbi:hypothetical protein GCM10020367_27770 [Streptomyces sannanensis]|uniref:Uncharacterized protein n=1 Tax=Streptomyces sannanensis TaxID=285536 RepID=A0ABP6SC56_9ACTN